MMMCSSRRLIRAICAAGIGCFAATGVARADFQVRSPIIEYREIEFEMNGLVTRDGSRGDRNGNQSYTYSIGAGLAPYWSLELEGEAGADASGPLNFEATTIESTVQFAPQGEDWADTGFFFEYSRPAHRGDPSTVTFGPLVQKETIDLFDLPMLHTANLLFEKELGSFSTDRTGVSFAWQSRVQLSPYFEPGIEYYAGIDDLGGAGAFADQEHRVGPVFAGLYNFGPSGKIKYQFGYLFGLSRATEQGALRFRLEYEVAF